MFTIPPDVLETPALVVDLDAAERNISRMQAFLKDKTAKLRPHFKTAKITALVKMQMAAGAKGATCAKLGEAEVLAEAGIDDILIANEIVWQSKIQRLAELCARSRICVAVESLSNAMALAQACRQAGTMLYCLVEIDSGGHRCGVRDIGECITLAKAIDSSGSLVFEGIQAYESHLVLNPDETQRREGFATVLATVRRYRDALMEAGLPVHEVSGGGTGTFAYVGNNDVFTELQAGSYLYMDARYAGLGLPFEQSLYVVATVMSKHPGVAFTDAGTKSFGLDFGSPVPLGCGGHAFKLNEEHGCLDDPDDELQIGRQIAFVPGHCCTTVNLYDRAYGVRNGTIERIFTVDGRGKSV
jgi:D-serine deaminase-like pyridoxal phosphate-dependent protein